jgi:hypothetical protein
MIMKKLILLSLVAISTLSYSQKLTVTPSGLRDANDSEKTFVVINAEGKTSKQLYDNALKYINKNYKSPDDVIKGKTDGEYLKFITHVSNFLIVSNSGAKITIDADYTIELNFKDGKIKFEIIALDMYAQNGGYKVIFSGGAFDGYPIYNKKGDLKRPDTKTEIETYFNSQINSITEFLLGKSDKDNW